MRRARATEDDLFLFARVASTCRNGQSEVTVPNGMYAASRRLERAGLVQRNPTVGYPVVSLATGGEKTRDMMLALLERMYER